MVRRSVHLSLCPSVASMDQLMEQCQAGHRRAGPRLRRNLTLGI
jgi:hypothetical protein